MACYNIVGKLCLGTKMNICRDLINLFYNFYRLHMIVKGWKICSQLYLCFLKMKPSISGLIQKGLCASGVDESNITNERRKLQQTNCLKPESRWRKLRKRYCHKKKKKDFFYQQKVSNNFLLTWIVECCTVRGL